MALTRFQDVEVISTDMERLIGEMERLRVLYEKYFLGLERKEPSDARKRVLDLIRKYAGTDIQNTRLKFRYNQLVAKYNAYCTYWDRILREIEEGRYERDVFKAHIHEKTREEATSPKAKPKPSKTRDPIEVLFQKYVEARTKCGEDVSKLQFDQFQKTMRAQVDALKKKTGATGVRFQISTADGKAKIKAIPQTKTKGA